MESTRKSIIDAISGGDLDIKNLEELDLLLTVDPTLLEQAQSLLPAITDLAQAQPGIIDSFPQNLIPKILSGASLGVIFNLIPPQLFKAGLDQASTASLLVQMLCRVEKDNKLGLELCDHVIEKLLDPSIEYTGQIEKLVAHLISIGYSVELPDQQLYDSTDPRLQSRLMALNLIQLKAKIPPKFLFWDLTSPSICDDPLLLNIHVIYIGDLCTMGVDTTSQMQILCRMYLNDEPFVGYHIENVFIKTCESAPLRFKHLDSEYGLTDKKSTTLLARLPVEYLSSRPEVVESLVLSSQTLATFCNLVTSPATFRMLNLSVTAINGLPFDLRAQLIAAATINSETARLFVGRFPAIVDAIEVPALNPEAAKYQREIKINLKRNGLKVPDFEIATMAAQ